jgi:hypothetical protein
LVSALRGGFYWQKLSRVLESSELLNLADWLTSRLAKPGGVLKGAKRRADKLAKPVC